MIEFHISKEIERIRLEINKISQESKTFPSGILKCYKNGSAYTWMTYNEFGRLVYLGKKNKQKAIALANATYKRALLNDDKKKYKYLSDCERYINKYCLPRFLLKDGVKQAEEW